MDGSEASTARGAGWNESATAAPLRLRTQQVAWTSLAALAAGHFAVDCCTGIWPVFKTLAHLNLAKAGLIAAVGSISGNALQVVFGTMADRGWRRRLLVGGVLLSGAVTLLPWTASYAVMFALVLTTYIGSAALHPAGTGAAGALSSSRTGVVVGIFLAGGYAGYSLSQMLFSLVYEAAPLLTPILFVIPVAAAIGMAVAVPPVAARRLTGPGTRTLLRTHRAPLAALFSVQVFATAINLALIFLLPDLLLARSAPGWMVRGGGHFALVLGGCLALLPAGHAADRWGPRRVLLLANGTTGILLIALLMRHEASLVDLLIVGTFGALNGVNNVVSVAEGNRMLPGRGSAASGLLMGLPWCFAATASAVAGLLADPTRGGSPVFALSWLGLAIPMALAASFWVPTRRAAAKLLSA